MFGKTKDIDDRTDLESGQFFGDEAAAAETVRLDEIIHRVGQVEQQVNSQFTSLAAYAQIAQEQIETARSEAKHATERAERRVTELIERERADRITAIDGPGSLANGSGWTAPDVAARLDTLERSVSAIQHGLNECLARQKALADAITALFQPRHEPVEDDAPVATDDEAVGRYFSAAAEPATFVDAPTASDHDLDDSSDTDLPSADEIVTESEIDAELDADLAPTVAADHRFGFEDDLDGHVEADDVPVSADGPALPWPDADERTDLHTDASQDASDGVVPPPPVPALPSVEPIGGLSLL